MKYLRPLPCVLAAVAAVLAACGSTPLPPMPPATVAVAPSSVSPQPGQLSPQAVLKTSAAVTPRAYRQDAASHIYERNSGRIFQGKLPPLLYAIGVLDVELDGKGMVRKLDWRRAPHHAPEVVAEIERTVRAAAPFPVPSRMGKVTYTDVWLWDKSGKFQLDTLTEGQL
jgi:periplasmic protein TonB